MTAAAPEVTEHWSRRWTHELAPAPREQQDRLLLRMAGRSDRSEPDTLKVDGPLGGREARRVEPA
jgi:hypothetical protein